MHANAWNLKSNKERLSILERTHAQKKHLLNLLRARTTLDTRQPSHSPRPAPAPPAQQQRHRAIQQDNESMIRRIIKIGQPKAVSRSNELAEVVRNLKTYSSLNRTIRRKEIEQENSKIFSRLIMTSPTIRRDQWLKRNIQTSKYKENLHRGKYPRPDYSLEACKIIASTPKFRNLNAQPHSRTRPPNTALHHSALQPHTLQPPTQPHTQPSTLQSHGLQPQHAQSHTRLNPPKLL